MAEKQITVTRAADGQVHVEKGTWSDTFAEERREPWAKWYDHMHGETGYVGYKNMAEALRKLPPLAG